MIQPCSTYRLSQEADRDLEEIFDYTVREFVLTRLLPMSMGLKKYL
jgi:plasmid stabilization system protein ParE